jgi:hypothetical protein
MSQNYTIKESTYDHDFKTQHGTFYSYNLTLVDVRGEAHQCYMNQKDTTPEPMIGGTVYGYIAEDKMGNPKFTKEPMPDGQPARPPQGATTAPKATQTQAFGEDERQTMIVRQNALTNANSNAAARSQVFLAQKKYEDAERVLKPSSIAFIQHWFYKASMGEWRMDMKVGDALELMGFSEEDIDNFVADQIVKGTEGTSPEEES